MSKRMNTSRRMFYADRGVAEFLSCNWCETQLDEDFWEACCEQREMAELLDELALGECSQHPDVSSSNCAHCRWDEMRTNYNEE